MYPECCGSLDQGALAVAKGQGMMDEGAQDCGFDAVITDDGILDLIMSHLEPQDVLSTSFVNKRWKNVAMSGPQHTPIPLCLQQLFQVWDLVFQLVLNVFLSDVRFAKRRRYNRNLLVKACQLCIQCSRNNHPLCQRQ